MLACLERNVPLITVENPSVLSVMAEALGLSQGVLQASSYSEAAGPVLALREGLSPASLGALTSVATVELMPGGSVESSIRALPLRGGVYRLLRALHRGEQRAKRPNS